MHLAGGGIRTDIFSIYIFILSKCFSQKCWIVSRIGYGSNTEIRWEMIEFPTESSKVTLVLWGRLGATDGTGAEFEFILICEISEEKKKLKLKGLILNNN